MSDSEFIGIIQSGTKDESNGILCLPFQSLVAARIVPRFLPEGVDAQEDHGLIPHIED
jgi:hypothetical protein